MNAGRAPRRLRAARRPCAAWLALELAVAAPAVLAADATAAADAAPAAGAVPRSEELARSLVARMTLDEKLAQLLNVAPAIPRLGVPAYNWWTESLHGALGPVPTTNFPEPIALAASFDPPLVGEVAAAISEEVRALHALGRATGHLGRIGTGLDTWSPNINLFRDPRWGRGQETYGEDPFLTSRLAVAFVGGMQGPDPDLPRVTATPKHFAVHSGPESTRHQADVFVSRHDLEDSYLPAFRAAIVEAHAGSIMCAYNSVQGQPACASQWLLGDHLRGAWGFGGYVVSDCDAVADISANHHYAPDPAAAAALALRAGVDNECNTRTLGGATDLAGRYREAWQRGLLGTDDIDRALVRLVSARYRTGDLPGLRGDAPVPLAAIDTPAHRALALRAAIAGTVMLENHGVLPLRPGARIALVGPLADATRVLRGNYSSPASAPPVSVAEGLRRALPAARIALVPFTPTVTDGDLVPVDVLRTPDGRPGVRADYFNSTAGNATASNATAGNATTGSYEARPVLTRIEPGVASSALAHAEVADAHRVEWHGYLVPRESGTYRLAVSGVQGQLLANGRVLLQSDRYSQWGEPLRFTEVALRKGTRYELRFHGESQVSGLPGLFWKRIAGPGDRPLDEVVARSDVVVAVVGLTSDLEGEEMPLHIEGFEGGDRTDLRLPADQRQLLEHLQALGKPVVVVLMTGSAIDLSWAKEHAAGLLVAWYPGQAGGDAVAQVLAGQADPGGRLPLTFYKGTGDLPPFDDYSMQGRTYRYFGGRPVYAFGAGQGYATYEYRDVAVERLAAGGAVRVSATVRNTSKRAGTEVAQLYLVPPPFEGAPRLALRGMQRLALGAGEGRTVTFELAPRDLSFVDRDGNRRVFAGDYRVSVGSGQPGEGVAHADATLHVDADQPLPP